MRCVDLFSGCGGLSLGFEKAGFNVVAAYDHWQPAIDVYKENFSHPIKNIDLTNENNAIEEISCQNPELIMGGPPCQDFSSAGKRDISLGHADLTYHFANIVCAIKPEWFVMENVEQIKKSYILQDIISQFSDKGYGLSSVILDASYCGVPQARKRFFLTGHLGDKHNQLNEIFNHEEIIDNLSYNTKNDKAFASAGNVTNQYMSCPRLESPAISQSEIKNIIGGQNMLSPERRFDAIIYNSPELFQ
jgi:DNA (cytosine-5)-methyltransferase 1